MRLVENDECFIQRATSHIGQRNDLDHILIHQLPQLVVSHHFVDGIEKRTEIRVDFGVHIARQKTKAFPRLYGGANEHDFANQAVFQGLDSKRYGQVSLAGSGGTDSENDIVGANRFDVGRLAGGPRLDLATDLNHVDLGGRRRIGFGHAREGFLEIVRRKSALALDDRLELLDYFRCQSDFFFVTGDSNLAVPVDDFDIELFAYSAEMLVASPK